MLRVFLWLFLTCVSSFSAWTSLPFRTETCLLASFSPASLPCASCNSSALNLEQYFTWALYFDQVFVDEKVLSSTRIHYAPVDANGTMGNLVTMELLQGLTDASANSGTEGVLVFVDNPRRQVIVVGNAKLIWVFQANSTSIVLGQSLDAVSDSSGNQNYFRLLFGYDSVLQRMIAVEYVKETNGLFLYQRDFTPLNWLRTSDNMTKLSAEGSPDWEISSLLTDSIHRRAIVVIQGQYSFAEVPVFVYDLDSLVFIRNITIPGVYVLDAHFPNRGLVYEEKHLLYLPVTNLTEYGPEYILVIDYISGTFLTVQIETNRNEFFQTLQLSVELGYLFIFMTSTYVVLFDIHTNKYAQSLAPPAGGMSTYSCGDINSQLGLALLLTQNSSFNDITHLDFAGAVSTIEDLFSRQVCLPGVTNAQACFPCPIGQFVLSEFVEEITGLRVLRRVCAQCPSYSYSPNISSSQCLPCPTAASRGSSVCEPCPFGSEGDVKGAKCVCSQGFESVGAVCAPCVPGTFKNASGADQCSSCWEFSKSSSNLATCECTAGYFLAQNRLCVPCPSKGASCGLGKYSNIEGFWFQNTGGSNQLEYLPCPMAGSCKVDQCAEGYEGVLCGKCKAGYGLNSAFSACVPCGSVNGILLSIALILMLLLLCYFWGYKVGTSFMVVKILLHYLQYLGQVHLTFPQNPLQFLPYFQLDFFADPQGCVAPMSFLESWAFHTYVIPVVLQLLAFLSFIGLRLVRPCKLTSEEIKTKYFRVIILLLQFSYLLLLKRACMMLTCTSVLGELRLYVAPEIICGSEEHIVSAVVAGFTIVVFSCGFPFSLYLFISKKVPKWMQTQDPAFLVAGYKNQLQEVYYLCRKFAVIILFAICRSLADFYLPWIMLVLFLGFLSYHTYQQPFLDNTNNLMEFLALFSLVVSFALELLVVAGDSGTFPQVFFSLLNFTVFAVFLVVIGKVIFRRTQLLTKPSPHTEMSPIPI